MCRFVHTMVLAGIALVGATGPVESGACFAAEPHRAAAAAEPTDGVLLLGDGGVLVGRVSRRADRYVVAQPHSEISVPANQVMLLARSLADAYEQQRGRMSHPTAEAHLQLAEWCLRYDLGPQAARELVDARGLDPRHPKLALLERRLAVLAAAHPQRETLQVEAAQPGTTPSEELDRLAGLAASLPDGALERFTRKVQPVLVNNCTTAGCHQAAGGEQSFHLDRAMLHGLSNRRSTLRNLAATLELIDRDAPQRSVLLTVPCRPHGGMDQPVFGPRQDQLLAHLADWVAMVTGSGPTDGVMLVGRDRRETPGSVYAGPPAAKLVAPVHRVPHAVVQAVAGPAAGPSRVSPEGSGVVTASHEVEASAGAAAPRLRYGARLTPWQAKDPFDPEIFNRQFGRADGADRDAQSPAIR